MSRSNDRNFDPCIEEIRACLRGERSVEGDPREPWHSLRSKSMFEIGRSMADIAFACDATHTLRDWEWHIAQGHVTVENQYKRYC